MALNDLLFVNDGNIYVVLETELLISLRSGTSLVLFLI